METGMVFVKTDKGHEEISKRTYHLTFKHRTALILVDGENAVEALLGKIPGDGTLLLEELLRDGFIEAVRGSAAGTKGGAADTSPGPSFSVKAGFDLETAKHDTVLIVEAVLGPGGESLAIAIEGCKTQTEFARQAARTRDLIAQVGGQRKAAEFWTQTGLTQG